MELSNPPGSDDGYHCILHCSVLIDWKLGKVQHHDIRQTNPYLGYFANEENVEGGSPPIGIILSRQKDGWWWSTRHVA